MTKLPIKTITKKKVLLKLYKHCLFKFTCIQKYMVPNPKQQNAPTKWTIRTFVSWNRINTKTLISKMIIHSTNLIEYILWYIYLSHISYLFSYLNLCTLNLIVLFLNYKTYLENFQQCYSPSTKQNQPIMQISLILRWKLLVQDWIL